MIVDRSHRKNGIGRRLVETAIEESRRRGATDVNIKPVARNESAIGAFHRIGFRTLGHLQLFISLDRDESYWSAALEVHGRPFKC
jgi:GNAT superfamily N-acetyltransferase